MGMGALPSIGACSNALEEARKNAEIEIKRGQDQLAGQKKLEEELRRQVRDIDPEESERRAKVMVEQRDKLIAKKKEERDKKVKEEKERKAKSNCDSEGAFTMDGEVPDSVLRARAEAQARAR
jgi:hypothetical protein